MLIKKVSIYLIGTIFFALLSCDVIGEYNSNATFNCYYSMNSRGTIYGTSPF
jgi:hypothetical protein